MPKTDEKPTILWLSDSHMMPTGFGQQTEYVTQELAKRGYKMHLIGWQNSGIKYKDQYRREIIAGMPWKFGEGAFDTHVMRIKPDIVFCLTDWWNTSYLVNKQRANDWAHIQWLPIDGRPYDDSIKWNDTFTAADSIIMLAKYGYDQMMEAVEWAKKEKQFYTFPELSYIYHGVDTSIFRPMTEEEEHLTVREQERERYDIHQDAVVYICVARNQPRKNYPVLFKAWADFIEKHQLTEKDAVLWIHALKRDSAWDLEFLREILAINPRRNLDYDEFKATIKFTPDLKTLNDSLSPIDLAKIYNMADYFILPTTGEGFGVPTIEAMACGLPVILTNCTTSPELANHGKNGILIKYDWVETQKGNIDRFVISRKGLLKAIEKTYIDIKEKDGKLRKRLSKNAVKWVSKNCDFNLIVDKIDAYLMDFWERWKNRPIKDKPKFGDHFDDKYMQMQLINRSGAFAKLERKHFLGMLPPRQKTILDVGCGSGEDMIDFNRNGYSTLGIDVSDAAISYCRERGLSVSYGDITKLSTDLGEDKFDAVWASHVIEHIEDWKQSITEMWKVSKRVIGFSLPRDNMRDSSHVRPYKEEEIKEMEEFIKTLPDFEDVISQKIWSSHMPPISFVVMGYKKQK